MRECPSELQPADFECPTCNGEGCPTCGRRGSIKLTSCARRQVTPDVWRMLKWALRAEERGVLPAAGGGMDQAQSFLDAWDFIGNELRYWQVRLKLKS